MLGIEHGIIVVVVGIFGALLGILVVVSIIQRRHSPGNTLAWLLLVILLPYVGVPLYLVFGGRKQRRMASRKPSLAGDDGIDLVQPQGEMERILHRAGVPCARDGNGLTILSTGEQAYETMVRLVDQATDTLWITTYILSSDEVGEALLKALARRAREGVQVRLLLDAMGSMSLGGADLADLAAGGGRYAFFMPISRLLSLGRPDLRIHRKILVADGRQAVVGGRNVAKEYMGPSPHPDRWTDLSILIEGPAVADVADVFAQDWLFASGEELPPSGTDVEVSQDGGRMQVVASGPDVDDDPIYEMLVTAIFEARHRVWLASPYFVPDEVLELALVLAVRRGVDTRIVVPAKSDHWFVDLTGRSFLRRIEAEGGRILQFEPAMMHAKVGVFDEALAMVGSANLDIRSLFLNYEIAALLYATPQVRQVAQWMESLFPSCSQGLPAQTRRSRFLESMGRLVAPMA